jgi:primosomal protein N' (replication factor Y)
MMPPPVEPAASVRSTSAVADVALPVPVRKTFAYRIPRPLRAQLQRGCRVNVPFGSRLLTGFVVGFDPPDAPAELKEVHSIVDPEPLVDESLLALTSWIADRTLCSWGEALRAALPGHAPPRREKILSLGAPRAGDLFGAQTIETLEDRILTTVGEAEELSLPKLAKKLGMRVADVQREMQRLVRAGRLRLSERVVGRTPTGLPRIKIVRLTDAALAPSDPPRSDPGPPARGVVVAEEPALTAVARAPLQARCVEMLREAGGEIPLRDLAASLAGSRGAVPRLVEKGLATVTTELWEGRDVERHVRVPEPDLNPAQRAAADAIAEAVRSKSHRVFLLHGVTGSGKTEVYLRAMAEARRLGRQSILLVPEITLTPQTVSRVRGRFGGRAAVFHSRLSDAERRRIWHGARRGDYDVVLGPRSAVFTPLPSVGVIVLDEEHDGAYKQEETPRYQARDVAIERARLEEGVVVMGSATPDIETHARGAAGELEILRLPDRVSDLPLPAVQLVDLRGTKGIFSNELLEAVGDRLRKKEQIILFLNRRGFSPFVQCGACGDAIRCGQCAVTLTYHRVDESVRCHYCDHVTPMPEACPVCRARRLYLRGTGTQRVEEELRRQFPDVRLARLDSDAVRRPGAHEDILGRFLDGEIDVLLGTQMVAKGLDFPRVTLVGVVNADIGLHLPDYRASERTFQLLAQVAGRAGRSELGGDVLVQTRCPEHTCLKTAAQHDDMAFRETEIVQRKDMRYPPFARLASVLVRGPDLSRVESAATIVRDRVAEAVLDGSRWIEVLGPAPAPLAQLRGKHRLRLLIKGELREDVRAAAARALEPLTGHPDVEVIVDTDPLDML